MRLSYPFRGHRKACDHPDDQKANGAPLATARPGPSCDLRQRLGETTIEGRRGAQESGCSFFLKQRKYEDVHVYYPPVPAATLSRSVNSDVKEAVCGYPQKH